jgi:hypothetical protein
MKDVPVPPRTAGRASMYAPIFEEIRKLGFDQHEALRIAVASRKHFDAARTALRKAAAREKLLLCTSRNQDSTVLFAWLVKPQTVSEAKAGGKVK